MTEKEKQFKKECDLLFNLHTKENDKYFLFLL